MPSSRAHNPESHDRESLEQWDREIVWHAFTQMSEYEPLIVDRAEGVWLTTDDGRILLDGASSLWCNVHGHRHPRIDAAIRQQLDRVAHVTSLGMSNSTTICLAKRLVDLAPGSLECVFFSSDGSCAVEVALKMAVQYWRQCDHPEPQRCKFLAVGNGYHGDTLGSVSVSGVSRFRETFAPLLFDVIHGPCPDSYRLPEGVATDRACEHYLSIYAELLDRHSSRLAAVVLEPLVQGAAGMVMHPPGFLAGMRRLSAERGLLLIADEVAVGLGRTGRLWACEWEDVAPDFLCIGKGLSGGYLPIAATLATRRVWNAFLGSHAQSRTFYHGHTYSGNPLAAAAALATLDLFDEERTLENVALQSQRLRELIEPLRAHPHVGDIRQRGLIAAIELVEERTTRRAFPWTERRGQRVCLAALKLGVWTRPIGDVLVLIPPLCIQTAQLKLLVDSIRQAIDAETTAS